MGRDADGVLKARAGAVCSELCRQGLLDEWGIRLEQPSVFIKSQTRHDVDRTTTIATFVVSRPLLWAHII